MKTYEVEIRRTSYITITVEAKSRDEAEEKAWEELASREYKGSADYETESIEALEVQS